MNAKTRQQYEDTWREHIRQLAPLGMAADLDDIAEYDRVMVALYSWVRKASARQIFEEDTATKKLDLSNGPDWGRGRCGTHEED